MKKRLLVVFCLPLSLFAQSITHSNDWLNLSPLHDKASEYIPVSLENEVSLNSPVQIPATQHRLKKTDAYNLHEYVIGSTTYDLQTNGSIARRLQLHPDGTVSAVWNGSNQMSSSFSDRGSFYRHFNGQYWVGASGARIEPERAGWPCIAAYDSMGTRKEIIVSHSGTSGGTFWMINDQPGSGSFEMLKKVDYPAGPNNPRMVAGGDYIHAVAVYKSGIMKNGVRNPVVYYRYNVISGNMEVADETLPGYDNSRYGRGLPDSYDIDVRDNIVAILIGDRVTDLALWKSTDYGKSWKKTIIDSFAYAPYDYYMDEAWSDTAYTTDGTASLVIDKGGIVHLFYPRMRVINPVAGDGYYSYFPTTDGILYWNDNDQKKSLIARTPDIDRNGYLDIPSGTTKTTAAGYGTALSTMPHAAVDANDNIYMVYTAPNELDVVDMLGPTGLVPVNARDIFIVYSKDHGKTWSEQQNITQGHINQGKEDVYATVARDADAKLHLMWMQDDNPGIYLINNFELANNDILYAAIPTKDILNGKIDNPEPDTGSGIQNHCNNILQGFYPNPAHDNLVVTLNIEQSASANVRMTDMLGKVHYMQSFEKMPAGQNSLNLDITHLKPGMYLLETRVGEKVETAKVLVN